LGFPGFCRTIGGGFENDFRRRGTRGAGGAKLVRAALLHPSVNWIFCKSNLFTSMSQSNVADRSFGDIVRHSLYRLSAKAICAATLLLDAISKAEA
jgi:hypothetical protein